MNDFHSYFNAADEVYDATPIRLTVDDLDPSLIRSARRAADSLGLPWPPSLVAAEEYLLDHPEVRS